jgi:hypothetical protein
MTLTPAQTAAKKIVDYGAVYGAHFDNKDMAVGEIANVVHDAITNSRLTRGFCAIHESFLEDGQPCWACVNPRLQEMRDIGFNEAITLAEALARKEPTWPELSSESLAYGAQVAIRERIAGAIRHLSPHQASINVQKLIEAIEPFVGEATVELDRRKRFGDNGSDESLATGLVFKLVELRELIRAYLIVKGRRIL